MPRKNALTSATRVLRDMVERLDMFFQAVPEGITVQDSQGRLIYANTTMARLIGFETTEELLMATIEEIMNRFEVFDKDGRMISFADLPGRVALKGKVPPPMIVRYLVKKSGQEYWSIIKSTPISDAKGKVIYAVNAVQDITLLMRAEKKLKDSEQQYRMLVETAPDVIYSFSTDGTIMALSPSFNEITGWKSSQWIGKHFASLIYEDDIKLAMSMFKLSLSGKKTPPFELRVKSRKGRLLTGEFRSVARIKGNTVVGIFGIARDVTHRKKIEDQLRFQKMILEAINNTTKEG